MILRKNAVLFCAAVSLFVVQGTMNAYGQMPMDEPAPQLQGIENPILWLWGEVVSVDADKNTVVVKYLDYETDADKELTLVVDKDTTFENVQSLYAVKALDSASIDYVVNANGTAVIKNISIEKEDAPVENPGAIGPDSPAVLPTPELPPTK